jgi:hypothetical protein
MASDDKNEEQKQALRREQALLKFRQDAEKTEELTRIARLSGPIKTETDQHESTTEIKEEEADGASSKPEPKDFRVKIEEVEDEDIKCTLASKAAMQEPPSFKSDLGVKVFLSPDITMDDPNQPMIPGGAGFDLDEPSDDEVGDNLHDGGMSDHDHFVPATFDDDDDVDNLLDLDAAELRFNNATSSPSRDVMGPPSSTIPLAEQKSQKVKEETSDDSQLWSSVGQLVAFRETSVAIAEDYLKTQGVKIRKRTGPVFTIKSDEASILYQKGKEDAKKIDVRRKLLKDAEDDS